MCGPSAEAQPVRKNTVTEYCADMNVILTYYKCMDDWQDEHKPLHYAYARILKNCGNMHMSAYPEKIRKDPRRTGGAFFPGKTEGNRCGPCSRVFRTYHGRDSGLP